MPYVKYRGVWSGAISELVCYEDPNAPCKDGLEKLTADARRFAEDAYRDPQDRAQAIKQYIIDHPYPGLAHIGGIGIISETPSVSVCEEISAAQYQQLRAEIAAANKQYHTQKAEKLSRNNDPLRRANPEHEDLGWRTRVWVVSYTELEHHVAYPLGASSAAYLRVRQDNGSGSTAQLIDIYHSSEGDIQQALLEGTDLAEMLADLLALSGYAAARVDRVLGTTVPYCKVGEEFQVATFDAAIRNTPVPVRPDQFPATLNLAGWLVLRHVRDGLSAPLPTLAFASFWNALERQAEEDARQKNLKRVVKCGGCGTERTVGLDTKRSFDAMYVDAELEPSLFERHRSTRGTIQHGAKLPNAGYLDEVFQDLPQVQTTAVISVAKKVGIAPGTVAYLSACWPVTILSCKVGYDGKVNFQNLKFGVRAALNMLPQRICREDGRTIDVGMSDPKLDPFLLPPIES